MKRIVLPFVALSILLLGLTGCGQKGPLYHPDDEKLLTNTAKTVMNSKGEQHASVYISTR